MIKAKERALQKVVGQIPYLAAAFVCSAITPSVKQYYRTKLTHTIQEMNRRKSHFSA